MPKWLKIMLILAGLGIVGLGVIVGGIAWWISANKDRLQADGKVAQDEGTQFGKAHAQQSAWTMRSRISSNAARWTSCARR